MSEEKRKDVWGEKGRKGKCVRRSGKCVRRNGEMSGEKWEMSEEKEREMIRCEFGQTN